MTRPGKTNHLRTFIVLRNINLKNSPSYNLAVVSSRDMGLALEIQHLFSFKLRSLIIADSLSWKTFTSMAVISGVVLIKGRWLVGGGVCGRVTTGLQLEKRHSEAPLAQAISQTSHHTTQTTTEDEANV